MELGQHRQHLTLPLRNKPLRLWFALLLLGTQEGQPGMAVALNLLRSADSSAPSWVMPVPCLGPCKPLSERGHFSVAVTAALPWGRAWTDCSRVLEVRGVQAPLAPAQGPGL